MTPDTALKKFSDDIEKFVWHVETQTLEAKKTMATETIDSLVKKSPVLTGAYVKSMRVKENDIDRTHEPVQMSLRTSLMLQVSESEKQSIKTNVGARLKTKLFQITARKRIEDEINVSNAIPYNYMVEYTGWEKTRPYAVFRLTIEYLKQIAQTMTGKVKIT